MQTITRCNGKLFTGSILPLILCLFVFSSMSGCGWIAGPPEQDPMAQDLIEQLTLKNQNLSRFKGITHIRLVSAQGNLSGRAALAAIYPDRIRVEWLTFLGQPLMRFAADGKSVVIDLHDENQMYRVKQSATALQKLIQIPIGIEDLLKILKGAPPLPEYAAAQMRPAEAQETKVALIGRWHVLKGELKTAADHTIEEMTAFQNDGAVSYRVRWKDWRQQQGYELPRDIEITAGTGDTLSMVIDRVYPEVPVLPELFQLEVAPSH